jgi:hypothetical protein
LTPCWRSWGTRPRARSRGSPRRRAAASEPAACKAYCNLHGVGSGGRGREQRGAAVPCHASVGLVRQCAVRLADPQRVFDACIPFRVLLNPRNSPTALPGRPAGIPPRASRRPRAVWMAPLKP